MLINTGRGGLVDTPALIDALKDGQLGYLGLDVYEEEAQLFFEDRSDLPLQDDVLARLLTFPNVIITAHQAFLTHEAWVRLPRPPCTTSRPGRRHAAEPGRRLRIGGLFGRQRRGQNQQRQPAKPEKALFHRVAVAQQEPDKDHRQQKHHDLQPAFHRTRTISA
jgi:hypothetical protein